MDIATNPRRLPCGALEWRDRDLQTPDQLYCDGTLHYTPDDNGKPQPVVRCSEWDRAEINARVKTERARLAGVTGDTEPDFATFRASTPGECAALAAMERFVESPRRNLLLRGGTGNGKTRLLLAAHFALLGAGKSSRYVTPPELRDLLRRCEERDPQVCYQAQRARQALVKARVVLLDDLGMQGDERFRGAFAEGLKGILDESRGVWVVATNLSNEGLRNHPDLNEQILSRLLEGALILCLDGQDRRVSGAERVPE
jgi:DNA replication protein DnaC